MRYSVILLFLIFNSCQGDGQISGDNDRPNIVLIVADDLGFSDLGCFGSEISTPNLDHLAREGIIFTNFYTAATCSPTRAMLLSGTDNHVAGLGDMAERVPSITTKINQPGYEGYLNDRVISMAQLLKDSGYHTYMSGKWHLGRTPNQSPHAKGFEKSFVLMDAYASHFDPDPNYFLFWENDHYTNYPRGRFSSDVYTDKLVDFLKPDPQDDKPFFIYAAYTAPHWPLQAPQAYIEKYRGKYDSGYDNLKSQRYSGVKSSGVIPDHATLPDNPKVKGSLYYATDDVLSPWETLSDKEKKIESRKMEIYAAMVDNMDYNIGRLIAHLKEIGEYDNTYFFFFSDNGAASLDALQVLNPEEPLVNMGTVNSFVGYGSQWAHASAVPYRLYKGYSTDGGIHSPMFVKRPTHQKSNRHFSEAFTTVKDIMPTFLNIAGVKYDGVYKGKQYSQLEGSSLLPVIMEEAEKVHQDDYVMGWELFGRYALRKGSWKITQIEEPFGKGRFELYDLSKDPTELDDLSDRFPDKLIELKKHWEEYVNRNRVILTNY